MPHETCRLDLVGSSHCHRARHRAGPKRCSGLLRRLDHAEALRYGKEGRRCRSPPAAFSSHIHVFWGESTTSLIHDRLFLCRLGYLLVYELHLNPERSFEDVKFDHKVEHVVEVPPPRRPRMSLTSVLAYLQGSGRETGADEQPEICRQLRYRMTPQRRYIEGGKVRVAAMPCQLQSPIRNVPVARET